MKRLLFLFALFASSAFASSIITPAASGSAPCSAFASQAQAEAGSDTANCMNALRTAQAIAALETAAPCTAFSSQAEAEAGSNQTTCMNPLRTAQAIAALAAASSMPSGTTPPATCDPGDLFFDTDTDFPDEGALTCISTNTWVALGESQTKDYFRQRIEFLSGSSSGFAYGGSGGSNGNIAAVSGHPAINRMTTGASTSNARFISSFNSQSSFVAGPTFTRSRIIAYIRKPTAISNVRWFVGFRGDSTEYGNHRVGVEFDTSLDTEWQCVQSDGTRNAQTMGVSPSIDVFYRVEVYVVPPNAVRCSVDATSVSRNTATNWPSAALSYGVSLQTLTTAAATLDMDLIDVKHQISR